MQEKKNKILLITTQGCVGCKIISNLIKEAINISKVSVILEEKDIKDVNKKLIKTNNITDFPAVLLIQNDIIKFSFIGTRPAIVIAQLIIVHLK